jgi:hypothetical protein
MLDLDRGSGRRARGDGAAETLADRLAGFGPREIVHAEEVGAATACRASASASFLDRTPVGASGPTPPRVLTERFGTVARGFGCEGKELAIRPRRAPRASQGRAEATCATSPGSVHEPGDRMGLDAVPHPRDRRQHARRRARRHPTLAVVASDAHRPGRGLRLAPAAAVRARADRRRLDAVAC